MAIIPNLKAMTSISDIMAGTLKKLHEFIERECTQNNTQEAMVLMTSFTAGLIVGLRDKVETLEKGLGDKYLDGVNVLTQKGSAGLETIEKLNRGDPSLKESSSGIDPDDLPKAVHFLERRISKNIKEHLDALPLLLRNDITLTYALAMLVANILSNLDNKNVDTLINNFSDNIRLFIRQAERSEKTSYN